MGCCKNANETFRSDELKDISIIETDFGITADEDIAKRHENSTFVSQDSTKSGSRAQWTSQTEFLLTCIGYSVGLGNVWRFPYLCYKNGGGAFIIPYVLMMILVGMPLLFMEYSIGQYFRVGSLSIFKKVCPLFQGIGIGYSVLNGLVCVYYNVIIAIAIYYLFGSLTSVLPWSTCDNEWNTANCGDPVTATNQSYLSNTTNFSTAFNLTTSYFENETRSTSYGDWMTPSKRTSPSDEFFRLALLGEGPDNSFSNLGSVRWPLCLCLLLSWILVLLFVSRGIKSSGKVSYFTATFPYIMLTILVVRGATLDGAWDGICYFIVPDWEKLASPDVWFQAATQLFYSTNLAWGGMITMASYNTFNHNCYRDAIVINLVSSGTSIYAGFAVFSIIGYMAHENGVPIDTVIKSGPGLAFIAYPRALSLMPLAPLWSALFFFMLFLLGIGSQMVLIETVVTGFVDEFPRLGLNPCIRLMTTVLVCIICFLLGISMTTQGGMYMLQLMDHYSAGFCVLVIALVECLVINWIYGNSRMCAHVKEMMNRDVNPFWKLCWRFISPAIILAILLFSFIKYSPVEYNGEPFPVWADMLGWSMTLASNVPIIVVAVYVFYRASGSLSEKWRNATTAVEDSVSVNHAEQSITWGPDVSINAPVVELPVEASGESLAHLRRLLVIKDTKDVDTSRI